MVYIKNPHFSNFTSWILHYVFLRCIRFITSNSSMCIFIYKCTHKHHSFLLPFTFSIFAFYFVQKNAISANPKTATILSTDRAFVRSYPTKFSQLKKNSDHYKTFYRFLLRLSSLVCLFVAHFSYITKHDKGEERSDVKKMLMLIVDSS